MTFLLWKCRTGVLEEIALSLFINLLPRLAEPA